MEKKKPRRTGMQIYTDCIKVGKQVKARMIEEEILRGVERDERH